MNNRNFNYIDESNGLDISVINKDDFELLHSEITQNFYNQTKNEQFMNILLGIKFNMEDYLNNTNPDKIISVGDFLKQILSSFNIKSKIFSEYLNLKPSNFSSLINGDRKISTDLALKLGCIFSVISPNMWLSIQIKNDLILAKNEEKNYLETYKLENLIKLKNLNL